MNGKQRSVLFLTVISLAIVLLFPPFELRNAAGVIRNLGYGFLFDPPMYSDTYAGSVNVGLLSVELIVVLLIGGIVTFIFKDVKVRQT